MIFVASPLNGLADQAHAYVSPPVEDMDSGDWHVFPRRTDSSAQVRIPPDGALVLAAEVWEHDEENQNDRNHYPVSATCRDAA